MPHLLQNADNKSDSLYCNLIFFIQGHLHNSILRW